MVCLALALVAAASSPGVLSLSATYVELPDAKPAITVGFRDLGAVTFTLWRVDPTTNKRKKTKTWTTSLRAKAAGEQTTQTIEMDPPGPGVWSLEAEAGTSKAETPLYVTPYAAVVKLAHRDLLAWLVDAMSGRSVGGGRLHAVAELEEGEKTREVHLDGTCGPDGLCRAKLPANTMRVVVWVGKGDAWTYSEASTNPWDAPTRELLGYVITDRPLYKPGEAVGVKVFLRTRGGTSPGKPAGGRALRAITTNATGDEIDRRTINTNSFGTASFRVKLKKDASLGACQVTLENVREDDNVAFSQGGGTFFVEEYKPPEITVSAEPVLPIVPGRPVKMRVTAALYAGGAVAYAEGRARVTFAPFQHRFGPWNDEPEELDWPLWQSRWSDAWSTIGFFRRNQPPLPRTPCFDGRPRDVTFRTGEDGVAEIELEPACPSAPSHTASAAVTVTDLSRRRAQGSGRVNVTRTRFFADVKTDHFLYKPGEMIRVSVRAEDANGGPLTMASAAVRLMRVDVKEVEVERKSITLVNGAAEVQLPAQGTGPLRIEVLEGADQEVVAEADLWATSDKVATVPPWDGMYVLTDQRPVKAGTALRGLVVTPQAGGHVLLSLEGDSIYSANVLELRGRARYFELPVTGSMTPVVTLAASRIERTEHTSTTTDLQVFGSELPLDVKVRPAQRAVRPATALAIDVALAGAPAGTDTEVALSIVDDALFAIADPERQAGTDLMSFFARTYQGNFVQTVTSVDAHAFRPPPPLPPSSQPTVERPSYLEGTTFQSMMRLRRSHYGGGGIGDALGEGKGGLGYSGVGVGGGGANLGGNLGAKPAVSPGSAAPLAPTVHVRSNFGSSAGWYPELHGGLGGTATAEARFTDTLTRWRVVAYAVTASGHLGAGAATVRTTQPLMVRLQGPRFVTERDEVVLSAVITSRMTKRASVAVALDAPGLKALGPSTRTVTVAPGGDARVDVRFAVDTLGRRKFRAVARAGEAADAMEWLLPVSSHGAPQRTAFTGALAERFELSLTLPPSRNKNATAFVLDVSPTLLSVMLDALPYLADYPYGCVEQTLSRFVPAVAALRVATKVGAPAQRIPRNLDAMVASGLARLYGFQHSDGGWGWWEHDATDAHMTAYVVFGLALAQEAGVKIEASVLERGRAWLDKRVAAGGEPEELAFSAFALAATGGVKKQALDALVAMTAVGDRARAFRALALATAKDPRAGEALDGADNVLRAAQDPKPAHWSTPTGVETIALTLMAVSRIAPTDPRVASLIDFLVRRRQGNRWGSTRDSAFAVYALAEAALQARGKLPDGAVRVWVNGKKVADAKYRAGGADYESIRLSDAVFKDGDNKVTVEHTGDASGHYSAVLDVSTLDEDVKAHAASDVKVVRTYRPANARAASDGAFSLISGDTVMVEIALEVTKPLEYVMVEDLKPAGLETVEQRSGAALCQSRCTHAELRPDRIATFFRTLAPGAYRYEYELRAEAPGKFHAMPARLEAMYAPEIFATTNELRVEVSDAPTPESPSSLPRRAP